MTPLDKLASLPGAANFLRPGVTLLELQQLTRALTDVQAAEELKEARQALFKTRGHMHRLRRTSRCRRQGCGDVDDALARTDAARGQRGYTLPTARAFASMPKR